MKVRALLCEHERSELLVELVIVRWCPECGAVRVGPSGPWMLPRTELEAQPGEECS